MFGATFPELNLAVDLQPTPQTNPHPASPSELFWQPPTHSHMPQNPAHYHLLSPARLQVPWEQEPGPGHPVPLTVHIECQQTSPVAEKRYPTSHSAL